MEVDLYFLFERPDLKRQAILTIQPLAPLSMVNSMPGSYYKTEHVPDKFMLCGLFENMLNLHLSESDRDTIRKKIKIYYKNSYGMNFELPISPVGYKPLIHHLFQIELPVLIPEMKFYEDLWTQHLIGGDERHLNGAFNYDWRIEKDIINLKSIEEKNAYFVKNKDRLPTYYRSPKLREFLITNGEYLFKLKMTPSLFNLINASTKENNIGYLGTSEGWVNITLGELI